MLPVSFAGISCCSKCSKTSPHYSSQAKFPGPIIPIHPTAETIDGLRAISSPDELPADIALAVVAIPAGGVTEALKALQRNHVRGAIVFANGFNAPAEQDLRDFLDTSNMVVHGPNCMGLINANDDISLYPTRPTEKLKAGGIALLAQSGSAAISVMNSANAGFSKIVTMGSEFQWRRDGRNCRPTGICRSDGTRT
jgi:acetyltransferase